MGSDPLQKAQRILQRNIDAGVVVLYYHGLPEDWACDSVVEQMQYFQTCLYHHKGITPSSAHWDIDEYCIPPTVLQTDGLHGEAHHQQGMGLFGPPFNGRDSQAPTITSSDWSSFSQFVRKDLLWQQSRYARPVSIGDTMAAIDRYYMEQDCANAWCFYMFLSRIVHLKDGNANRRMQIGLDFRRIEPNETNLWHKSIMNTKYAHVAGIHVAGSCLSEAMNNKATPEQQMSLYHTDAAKEECNPNRFEPFVYGGMRHFFDLLSDRLFGDGGLADPEWNVDTYIRLYAHTVGRQLNRSGWDFEKID